MHFPFHKTVVVICGPTASGKTALAISLAKHFQTEIISADSRQCYKEMNIGVARPSEKELHEITHHFIASHSITENVTAADFEKFALKKTQELFLKSKIVILAGGTGLYIKAFCEGLDTIPPIPPGIRCQIIENYQQKGLSWLQEELKKKDPLFYEQGEIKNPQRMMRALEVQEATGCSILNFRKGEKAIRDFNITKIGLEVPKEVLHRRIHDRVDQMINNGLVEEVKSLLPFQQLPALQTVGYKEIFSYLSGSVPLSQAIDTIKKNTKQYAKRQMTWFRKDKQVQWFAAQEPEKIIQHLTAVIK